MCTADLGFTGGKNDIGAGTDTDFIGACTPALKEKCLLPGVDLLIALSSNSHPSDHAGTRRETADERLLPCTED